MKTPSHLVTCTKNERLSEGAFELRMRLPEGETIDFRPGQFILFDVPSADDLADVQPRAYSIASPPFENTELTFVLMNKVGGRATRWVREILKAGDTVLMKGPFGNFILDPAMEKEYLFIATGTGLAPMMSMLRQLLEKNNDLRRMRLVFGVRYEEDLFWVDRLNALARRHANFSVSIALSRPNDVWSGLRGRVTEILPTIITDFSRVQAYVCGNPAMTKDVTAWLLGQGMTVEDVKYEGYL